jgi:hypothetical protein
MLGFRGETATSSVNYSDYRSFRGGVVVPSEPQADGEQGRRAELNERRRLGDKDDDDRKEEDDNKRRKTRRVA